jgi:hypothetical protein
VHYAEWFFLLLKGCCGLQDEVKVTPSDPDASQGEGATSGLSSSRAVHLHDAHVRGHRALHEGWFSATWNSQVLLLKWWQLFTKFATYFKVGFTKEIWLVCI